MGLASLVQLSQFGWIIVKGVLTSKNQWSILRATRNCLWRFCSIRQVFLRTERGKWNDSATNCDGSGSGVRSQLKRSPRRRRSLHATCRRWRRGSTPRYRAGCFEKALSAAIWQRWGWMRFPGLNDLRPACARVALRIPMPATGPSLLKMCGETGLARNPRRICDGWAWG
jgi:hypothetical protein